MQLFATLALQLQQFFAVAHVVLAHQQRRLAAGRVGHFDHLHLVPRLAAIGQVHVHDAPHGAAFRYRRAQLARQALVLQVGRQRVVGRRQIVARRRVAQQHAAVQVVQRHHLAHMAQHFQRARGIAFLVLQAGFHLHQVGGIRPERRAIAVDLYRAATRIDGPAFAQHFVAAKRIAIRSQPQPRCLAAGAEIALLQGVQIRRVP